MSQLLPALDRGTQHHTKRVGTVVRSGVTWQLQLTGGESWFAKCPWCVASAHYGDYFDLLKDIESQTSRITAMGLNPRGPWVNDEKREEEE